MIIHCLRGMTADICPIALEQGIGESYCQVCVDGCTEEEALTEPFIEECPYCGEPTYTLKPHPICIMMTLDACFSGKELTL